MSRGVLDRGHLGHIYARAVGAVQRYACAYGYGAPERARRLRSTEISYLGSGLEGLEG